MITHGGFKNMSSSCLCSPEKNERKKEIQLNISVRLLNGNKFEIEMEVKKAKLSSPPGLEMEKSKIS